MAGSSEEALERCMHCFRDFPLGELVVHSARCTGDMLGSRDRFKEFLPSIHDVRNNTHTHIHDHKTTNEN